MTTALPPAGWYDDPEQSDQLRWWDGTTWTDRRVAANPSATSTVPSVQAPTAYPDAVVASEQSTWHAGGTGEIAYRPQSRAPATELASASDRFVAALLDGAFTFVVFVAFGILAGIMSVFPDALAGLLSFVAAIGVYGLLFVSTVMGTGRLGQSYGKHLMGIKVVSTHTGAPIGSPAAFGRGIVLTIGMYAFGLGVLWILWDPQRQGWHDKAVSSVVVKHPSPTKLDPFAFVRAIFDAG